MAKNPPFTATHVADDVFQAIDAAREARSVVLLVAEPGQGKTASLSEYAGREDSVLLHRAQVVNTPRSLVRALLWSLDTPWNGPTNNGFAVLRRRVAEYGIRIVLVDDVQRLARHTLDMLRALHEACGVGLVLAGTPQLAHLLPVRRGELAHHVRQVYALESAGLKDAIALVNTAAIGRKRRGYWERVAMARVLLEAGGGNFRRMLQIMEEARLRARRAHRPVSLRHVQEAVESSPGLAI